MPTYRLDVEYDGTRYHGWQEQLNARSIAGELRRAVTAAGASLVELGGSGRTDAGVHALAQTAHLRLRQSVQPEPFRRAVNDALPPDIHVVSLRETSPAFHARHDAVSRVYLYQIARRRAALAKRHVWWVKRSLDVRLMQQAARLLEGRHDFARYCERPQDQPSTIVVVERAEVHEAGALILTRLIASHFLWKMVRRIVGVLVKVGAGELPAAQTGVWLEAAAEKEQGEGMAAWTAPPSGLFLERVIYPGEPGPGPVVPAISVAPEPGPGATVFTGRPAPERSAPRPSPRGRRASRG
ncbi:MAG: tRNA pseudouridine(38-40) synthase TruA [Candidatus Polarisedimenticolia bacterium]